MHLPAQERYAIFIFPTLRLLVCKHYSCREGPSPEIVKNFISSTPHTAPTSHSLKKNIKLIWFQERVEPDRVEQSVRPGQVQPPQIQDSVQPLNKRQNQFILWSDIIIMHRIMWTNKVVLFAVINGDLTVFLGQIKPISFPQSLN